MNDLSEKVTRWKYKSATRPEQVVKVGKNLPTNIMKNMIKILQDNKDIFAWVASDMPGVDPKFCCL
jgi:hypothetical protein